MKQNHQLHQLLERLHNLRVNNSLNEKTTKYFTYQTINGVSDELLELFRKVRRDGYYVELAYNKKYNTNIKSIGIGEFYNDNKLFFGISCRD